MTFFGPSGRRRRGHLAYAPYVVVACMHVVEERARVVCSFVQKGYIASNVTAILRRFGMLFPTSARHNAVEQTSDVTRQIAGVRMRNILYIIASSRNRWKNAADTGTLLSPRATSRREGEPVLERQSDSDDYQDNDQRPMVPRKHVCPAQ